LVQQKDVKHLNITTMKIVVLLFASYFGFGLAIHETVRVHEPANNTVVKAEAVEAGFEQPVMDVLLDTVEVTVSAPAAIATK
jgi:hypothetical protein